MKCPFCGEVNNKVIDSRLSKDSAVIRRRRECIDCTRRFTTYEHIEETPIMIIKKDARRARVFFAANAARRATAARYVRNLVAERIIINISDK